MKIVGAGLLCAAIALTRVLVACGGSSEGEHTSTVVRGTYGDPNPIVACGDPGDAAAADAGADARPDGC